jgi:4a-hydroxytetrahydrobiopterin dehydratase
MTLTDQKCVPCEGGTMPLTIQKSETLMKDLNGWELTDGAKKIEKDFKFKNFAEALAFANQVGAIAEAEGHHPEIEIGWGKAEIELTTHAIGGLSMNDFIVAAKIDKI